MRFRGLFWADFSVEGGRNTAKIESRASLLALLRCDSVSEANAVHCNRLRTFRKLSAVSSLLE